MMNLIQFDFDKSRKKTDSVIKKAFPPSFPPFSKGRLDNVSVIFPLSSFPAALLYFEVLKVRYKVLTALCKT